MHNSYNAAANFSSANGGFLNYLWKNAFPGNQQQQPQHQRQQPNHQQQQSWSQQQQQQRQSNEKDKQGRRWG